MRLFHVQAAAEDEVNGLFETACLERGIEYAPATVSNLYEVLEQSPGRGDLLYNSGTLKSHSRIEAILANESVATFYRRADPVLYRRAGAKGIGTLHFERHGIPVPRTEYYVDGDRKRLAGSVDSLGGFPVVLKASAGQWGLGVVMVNGFDSLVSMVDFMLEKGERALIMQEFVDHGSILRTVTLGDSVVASLRYNVLEGDFRSASVEAVRSHYVDTEPVEHLPDAVVELSVSAARAAGVDFSGIDVLETKDGRFLVSELNFPCMHVRTELNSGVPVTAHMVDFLAEKSRRVSRD